LNATIAENSGPTTWKITNIQSNEEDGLPGTGKTSPDWEIIDDHNVRLRAERSGIGPGRLYTIEVKASDEAGNVSNPAFATVYVPRSPGVTTSHWGAAPKSRTVCPPAARLASRISEYLREKMMPSAPALNAAVVAAWTSVGEVFFSLAPV